MITATKKTIKVIAISVLVAVFFITGGITLFITTVNQDTIKSKIIQLVNDKTSRELKIAGDVSWSFFPWLSIKIQDVSLSNPADFKSGVFAKAQEAGVSIKLLPLIFGRIEADHLALKNLDLQLIKNSLGVGNWQDLLTFNHDINPTIVTKENNLHLIKFTISSIDVDNSSVLWQNQQTNKKIKIDKLNLRCKNVNFGRPFNIKTSFYMASLNSILDGNVDASMQLKLDIDKELYVIENLQLMGKLKNEAVAKSFDFSGNADIEIDLKKQNLLAENFKLSIASAVTTGSLHGAHIIDAPSFSGNLALYDPDPKNLMQLFGINAYSKDWTRAALKVDLMTSPGVVKLSAIDAKIGDMALQGNMEYSVNQIAFNFSLNQIDFDAITEKNQNSHLLSKADKSKIVARQVKSQSAENSNSLFKFLYTARLNGDLRVGVIQAKKLHFNNFTTKVISNSGLIECQKVGFDFYQGKVYGSANVDVRNATPQLNLKLSLKNAAMQALLMDFAQYSKFKGALALDTDINMHGMTVETMFNSLSGTGNVLISSGSYQGIDIPYEVRKVRSMLNDKSAPEKTQPPHTDFDQLTMHFRINAGLLSTSDFLIQAPDYKVTGQGGANLVSRQLNLLLSAYSVNDASFFIPIKITGAFAEPSVKLDVAVMIQHTVKNVVKDVLQNKAVKQLEKLNVPQNLKDILPLDKLMH